MFDTIHSKRVIQNQENHKLKGPGGVEKSGTLSLHTGVGQKKIQKRKMNRGVGRVWQALEIRGDDGARRI